MARSTRDQGPEPRRAPADGRSGRRQATAKGCVISHLQSLLLVLLFLFLSGERAPWLGFEANRPAGEQLVLMMLKADGHDAHRCEFEAIRPAREQLMLTNLTADAHDARC